jgi:hypothetical protein
MARGRGERIQDIPSMSTAWLKAALASREVEELSGDFDEECRASFLVPYRKAIEAELTRRTAMHPGDKSGTPADNDARCIAVTQRGTRCAFGKSTGNFCPAHSYSHPRLVAPAREDIGSTWRAS